MTLFRRPQTGRRRHGPLATHAEGDGPPLLFLHALGASGRYWRGRLGSLPTTHRCIMPDLLGFGRSPKPHVAYTVEDHLTAIAAMLEARGYGDEAVTLVGHSLGAILAVEYAARFPARVRGLILLALPRYVDASEARAHIGEHGDAMARVTVANGRTAHLIHVVVATFRPVLKRLISATVRDFPPDVAADALDHTWASYSGTLDHCVLNHDLTPTLAALADLPILAIHGADDPAAPLHGVRTLAREMPHLHLVVVPGGHHPLLEQPIVCFREIRDYLMRQGEYMPVPAAVSRYESVAAADATGGADDPHRRTKARRGKHRTSGT